MIDLAAVIGLGFWILIIAGLAWDEARREKPTDNDEEARRAFTERQSREYAGRDA